MTYTVNAQGVLEPCIKYVRNHGDRHQCPKQLRFACYCTWRQWRQDSFTRVHLLCTCGHLTIFDCASSTDLFEHKNLQACIGWQRIMSGNGVKPADGQHRPGSRPESTGNAWWAQDGPQSATSPLMRPLIIDTPQGSCSSGFPPSWLQKDSGDAVEVQIGHRVRIKKSVSNPRYGWGAINHDMTGILKRISGKKVYLDFPTHAGWEGLLCEIETSSTACEGSSLREK